MLVYDPDEVAKDPVLQDLMSAGVVDPDEPEGDPRTLTLDELTKVVGIWKATQEKPEPADGGPEPVPTVKRVLAFTNTIAKSKLVRDTFKTLDQRLREVAPSTARPGQPT